jgi:hypothetical protein
MRSFACLALLGLLAVQGCAAERDSFDRDAGDGGRPLRDGRPWIPLDDGDDGDEDAMPTVDVAPLDAADPVWDGGPFEDAAADAVAADAAIECQQLAERYARTVQEAQTCTGAGDCAFTVCETLCCSCEVFVNPASAAFPLLETLRSAWDTAECASVVACSATVCDPPIAAECSSRYLCTTLR